MKVFENPNIVIEVDEQLSCVIQNWRGFASSFRFREGIEQTIELFKKNNLDKILSNTKDFGIVIKEDTDWVNSYSMPLLIESGLKYMAFIVPDTVLPRVSIENFRKGSTGVVEIRYFSNTEKAKEWLREASE